MNRQPPTAAETSYNRKDFSRAETLYRDAIGRDPKDDAAHEGLVRALIQQNKIAEATKEAEQWAAADQANSMALVAVADAELREGKPREAYVNYQTALKADLCNARAYYGLARIQSLAGMHASSRKEIQQAYILHPTDDDIHSWWIWNLPRKRRLDELASYAEHSDQISDEDRGKLKDRLAKESLYHPTDCKAAPGTPDTATVPMVPVTDGPTRFLGWGLDVYFNGKRRRLQIDTGASGITISRAAAMFLGIQRQDATLIGGIGDQAKVKTSIAHVPSIKIGGIEFRNCPVEILDKWSVLDSDGLIGADVFASSQVTLDFPKHELRVAPLPERPGEKKEGVALDSAGDDAEPPLHDPYIAPEMAKWTHIYRSGHDLLIPGGIVDTKSFKNESAWKNVIFLLDTGAASNLISPAAARQVTKVSKDSWVRISGLQGEVNKVYSAGQFTLAFANLRLDSPDMTSIDLTGISHGVGMEVSGLIGAPALFQLVLHIDYRDNLVWCEYTPKK